jgi:predicted acylesterase/phospholipase RssA
MPPLRKTLDDLVDFQLINKSKPRLMVGAAHVRTSMMRYFDSRVAGIKVEHIMASGALPPAFPAVRIDVRHRFRRKPRNRASLPNSGRSIRIAD